MLVYIGYLDWRLPTLYIVKNSQNPVTTPSALFIGLYNLFATDVLNKRMLLKGNSVMLFIIGFFRRFHSNVNSLAQ